MTTTIRRAREFEASGIEHTGPAIEIESKARLTEDELGEEIWLINMELRGAKLTKRERIEARRQIAEYHELLSNIRRRSAGA